MKLARWFMHWLSGDDGYPIDCQEWQLERMRGAWRHSLPSSRRGRWE